MGSFEGVFAQSYLDRTIFDIGREGFVVGEHKTMLEKLMGVWFGGA